jgi:hypothetical protein
MQQKEKALMVGAIVSLFLLSIFGWLQTNDSKLLQLPTQWLAIAIFPIVVALFVGGLHASSASRDGRWFMQ